MFLVTEFFFSLFYLKRLNSYTNFKLRRALKLEIFIKILVDIASATSAFK